MSQRGGGREGRGGGDQIDRSCIKDVGHGNALAFEVDQHVQD